MDSAGARFAEAVARKDRAAIAAMLAPDVSFKGLTPGRFWEADDPEGVLEILFGSWFEDHDRIDAVEVDEGEPVVDTEHVAYRLSITTPDGPHVAAQQAYLRVVDDRIGHLRVMCSGFRAVPDGS